MQSTADLPAPGLIVRKLADRSSGERIVRFDPETGEKILVNPATGQPEPWPLAGIQIDGAAPERCNVNTTFVDKGVADGWITLEGAQLVVRPGGQPDNKHRGDKAHTFVHADALVIATDPPTRYRVVHQPDKYVADGDDDTPMTDEHYAAGNSRVDWFYGLELETT